MSIKEKTIRVIIKYILKQCLPSNHNIWIKASELRTDKIIEDVGMVNLSGRAESKGFENGAKWMRDFMVEEQPRVCDKKNLQFIYSKREYKFSHKPTELEWDFIDSLYSIGRHFKDRKELSRLLGDLFPEINK